MVSTMDFPFSTLQFLWLWNGPAAGSGSVRLEPTGLSLKADDLNF